MVIKKLLGKLFNREHFNLPVCTIRHNVEKEFVENFFETLHTKPG